MVPEDLQTQDRRNRERWVWWVGPPVQFKRAGLESFRLGSTPDLGQGGKFQDPSGSGGEAGREFNDGWADDREM